jgi:hypothetical protein
MVTYKKMPASINPAYGLGGSPVSAERVLYPAVAFGSMLDFRASGFA